MRVVVVGLGKTGASVVRYLAARGAELIVTDSRAAPPGIAALDVAAGGLDLRLGAFDLGALEGAELLVMSPGVSLEEPIAREARRRAIPIVGDIELFARAVRAPVVGITGTNGKSTVTSLVAHMAATAGRRVLAGGNLGEPALALLVRPVPQLYVLELSSFQLETTESLELAAAAVLNVTPDHLDRYASVEDYARAKARILARAATAVLNLDDARVTAMRDATPGRVVGFSLEREDADYALVRRGGEAMLAVRGVPLMPLTELPIAGRHNAANALAALALGEALALPLAAMRAALVSFTGLPHRSAQVAVVGGVRYVNDSKGTNVGATLAAVAGFDGPLVLIAGGEGKGQDFKPLAAALTGKVRHLVLIGKDADALATALAGVAPIERAASLEAAVSAAARVARPGDIVLLSPACASLDMFRDYAQRGEVFAAAVGALAEGAR